MKSWIVNASPLILLGKIKRLDLLQQLSPSVIIPHAVSVEVMAGPDGDPARTWIQSANAGSLVVPDPPPNAEILAWDLGAGETSVISLSLDRGGMVCVLDDLAARNCAKVFSIPVIGTLGILLKAKACGLIPALSPEIENLIASGSLLSTSIIREALKLANESN